MLYIDGKRRALLVVGGALAFALFWGVCGGVACGIFGALVGGGLGAIIE